MTQLFQDVRKKFPLKPHWIGDTVSKEIKGIRSLISSKQSLKKIKTIAIQMPVHHFIPVVVYLID